jgi:hypothetical protein
VLQRNLNGLEVSENDRYLLRDIYFSELKLSWDEWLLKHGHAYTDPAPRASYATGTIALEVKLVSGKWQGLKAAVLCQIDFDSTGPLTGQSELFRIFPPQPRPKNFGGFAKKLNELVNGKEADVSLLVCPDGKPYHELGQKRARRVYFPEYKATLEMLQNDIISGKRK